MNAPATFLVIAGLLGLLAGATGVLLWTNGELRMQVQSKWIRGLLSLVGAALIAFGLWHEQTLSRDGGSSETDSAAEQWVAIEALREEVESLRSELDLVHSNTDRLAVDARVGALQTALVITSTASDPKYCADGASAQVPKRWSNAESAPCASVINAFWPVEVVVPIRRGRDRLKKAIEELRTPVALAERSATHPGLTAGGLGMVFPEGTPPELICEIRNRFKANTSTDLVILAEARDFMLAARQPARFMTIQVGVPFGQHFAARLSNYRPLTDNDWLQICEEGDEQFFASVRERFAVLSHQPL